MSTDPERDSYGLSKWVGRTLVGACGLLVALAIIGINLVASKLDEFGEKISDLNGTLATYVEKTTSNTAEVSRLRVDVAQFGIDIARLKLEVDLNLNRDNIGRPFIPRSNPVHSNHVYEGGKK